MSYDRAEFASSKFVNAIGDKKDVQFAGKDLRSFRTSPNNLHGASYDEKDLSPSNTIQYSTVQYGTITGDIDNKPVGILQ